MCNRKRIFCAVMAFCLLLACFAGCEPTTEPKDPVDTTETLSKTAVYTVTVVDYKGNVPAEDVLVEIKAGDKTVGMKKADANGQVSMEMDRGDYTFTVSSAGGEIYYDTAACVLTAEKTEVSVAVYRQATEKHTIYVTPGDMEDHIPYEAALIGEGATYVAIDRTDIAYYLFAPKRGGMYRFSFIGGEDIAIGYYGDSNVVLRNNAATITDNAFELEVKNGTYEGATSLMIVVGLSSATAKDAILTVERIGDPIKEMPWTEVTAKQLPQDFIKTDYLNHALVDVSVTDASVKFVYNQTDGYYHYGTENGPIVYVRLSSASPFLAAFTELCETANLCRIFRDENGTVTKKETYNTMIASYAEICDDNGVCPLTEELKTMLINVGEHEKWWDFSDTGNEIFTSNRNEEGEGSSTGVTEDNIVLENAWMFACCYVNEFVSGTSAAPLRPNASDSRVYSAIVKTGEALYFAKNDTPIRLKIENAQGLTVHAGDATYTANASGVIEVTLAAEVTSFTVTSDTQQAFDFTFRAG